jgi:hypothetical protein
MSFPQIVVRRKDRAIATKNVQTEEDRRLVESCPEDQDKVAMANDCVEAILVGQVEILDKMTNAWLLHRL